MQWSCEIVASIPGSSVIQLFPFLKSDEFWLFFRTRDKNKKISAEMTISDGISTKKKFFCRGFEKNAEIHRISKKGKAELFMNYDKTGNRTHDFTTPLHA